MQLSGEVQSSLHAHQRLQADLEADERLRRVPAEGAGLALAGSFRAFASVAGRLSCAFKELCPTASCLPPFPLPPRAMLLPSDVARLVLGE